MASSLGCGSTDTPGLLLQYSYYLNPDATKCLNVGIDPFKFVPVMIIYSPTARRGVHLAATESTGPT